MWIYMYPHGYKQIYPCGKRHVPKVMLKSKTTLQVTNFGNFASKCKTLMFWQKSKNDLCVGNNILQKIRELFLKILGLTNLLHAKFKYNITTYNFNLTFY